MKCAINIQIGTCKCAAPCVVYYRHLVFNCSCRRIMWLPRRKTEPIPKSGTHAGRWRNFCSFSSLQKCVVVVCKKTYTVHVLFQFVEGLRAKCCCVFTVFPVQLQVSYLRVSFLIDAIFFLAVLVKVRLATFWNPKIAVYCTRNIGILNI